MEEPVKEKATNNSQVLVKKYGGPKKYLTLKSLKMAQCHSARISFFLTIFAITFD